MEVFGRLQEISRRLKKEYRAERVLLFGSHAKGTATENSDVDILVIVPTDERFFERRATVLRVVRDLYPGLALSPIVLCPDEVADRLRKGDSFIQEIVELGVEL